MHVIQLTTTGTDAQSELARSVVQTIIDHVDAVVARYAADPRSPAETLEAARVVLAPLPERDATWCKALPMRVITDVFETGVRGPADAKSTTSPSPRVVRAKPRCRCSGSTSS